MLKHGLVELLFAMEVVIGGGNVGVSTFANVADGCAVKALFGKGPEGGVQQTLPSVAGFKGLRFHDR